MKLMTWGFFKKLVIADNLAPYINAVYNNVAAYSGFVLVFATVLFAFQIYCDFSGYSEIAIGVAKLFDISLMTNFSSPYLSASLKEFWSRWHISLSTWFRDYVYIPLGGNRHGVLKQKRNLVITFLASGLWHGANWTFVFWGGLHGVGQAAEGFRTKNGANPQARQKRGVIWLLHVMAIFLLVCFAWIFFRANSISDTIIIVSRLFSGITRPVDYIMTALNVPKKLQALMGCCGIILLLLYDYASLKTNVWQHIQTYPRVLRYAIYYGLVFAILFFRAAEPQQFVYFQF
jgi:D-alanyl-lipoteichoic acid acyltransferase DltB (MBOAT superfamily)